MGSAPPALSRQPEGVKGRWPGWIPRDTAEWRWQVEDASWKVWHRDIHWRPGFSSWGVLLCECARLTRFAPDLSRSIWSLSIQLIRGSELNECFGKKGVF